MFVGKHLPKENPYQNTIFKAPQQQETKFSVNLDSNGLVQSLVIPSGITVAVKNIIKGWAAQLQINGGNPDMAFKAEEVKNSS